MGLSPSPLSRETFFSRNNTRSLTPRQGTWDRCPLALQVVIETERKTIRFWVAMPAIRLCTHLPPSPSSQHLFGQLSKMKMSLMLFMQDCKLALATSSLCNSWLIIVVCCWWKESQKTKTERITLVCNVITKNTASTLQVSHLFSIWLIQKNCRYKQLLLFLYALARVRPGTYFCCIFLFPIMANIQS